MTAAGIVLGVGGDALLGDPRRFHPVAGFGHVAAALERGRVPAHAARPGAAYAAVLVGGAALAGAALERVLPRSLARGLALWAALGGRSLAREAQAVADLVEARRHRRRRAAASARSSGRDPEALDGAGPVRGSDRVGGREHRRRGDRAAVLGRGRGRARRARATAR